MIMFDWLVFRDLKGFESFHSQVNFLLNRLTFVLNRLIFVSFGKKY